MILPDEMSRASSEPGVDVRIDSSHWVVMTNVTRQCLYLWHPVPTQLGTAGYANLAAPIPPSGAAVGLAASRVALLTRTPNMSHVGASGDANFGAPLTPLVAVVVGTTQGHVALYQRASDDARPSQTLTLPEWQPQEELTLLQWVVLQPNEVLCNEFAI